MTNLTLLTAHPSPRSFTVALAQSYARGAERAGARVELIDVTSLQFDPILRGAYETPMADEPDLARVRAALEGAEHVAWFFPTWWAGLPAVLKGLIDRLMLPGNAFVYEGGPLPRGLFRGRSSRYVATMDSPRVWYWLAHHDALGGSFGRGTLKYVGFGPVDRTLIYQVRRLSDAARGRWLQRLEETGHRDALTVMARSPKRAVLDAPVQR